MDTKRKLVPTFAGQFQISLLEEKLEQNTQMGCMRFVYKHRKNKKFEINTNRHIDNLGDKMYIIYTVIRITNHFVLIMALLNYEERQVII